MYKKIIQIIIISSLLQFSLLAQNNLEIRSVVKGKYDEQRELNISVSDSLGEFFSFEKKLLPHQSIPQIEVLSNNSILLIHSLEGIIEIYNKKGLVVSKIEFYNLPPYNEQRILVDIFDSGFALLVSESQKNKLYILNNNGNINFSEDIKDGLLKGLAVNKSAEFVAYSVLNWINDKLESEIIILNIENNSEIKISDQFETGLFSENDSLFFGFTNKTVFAYKLSGQKIIWLDKAIDNEIFIAGEIAKNKVLFIKSKVPTLIGNEWVYDNIQIIQKDDIGNEKVLFSSERSTKKIDIKRVNNKFKVLLDEESVELKMD